MRCPMCKAKDSFKIEDYKKSPAGRAGAKVRATLICKECKHTERV